MKRLEFLEDTLERLRQFPRSVRKETGVQLHKLQQGFDPSDWKPMTTVGPGVREIRVQDDAGAFRVIYVAKFEAAIFVLHAFQKKDQKTPRRDIDLAIARFRQL